jgi:peroxiredoxin Q/BCP
VRDALPDLKAAGVAAIGISPDPVAQQKKFDDRHHLGFALLSDSDHQIADAFGVWVEKKMFGKTSMGIARSAFLIDAAGRVSATGYNISPKETIPTLNQWLA